MNDEIIKFKKGKTLIMIAEGDPLEKARKTDKGIDVSDYTEPSDDKVKEALDSLKADGIEDLYLYCRKTTTTNNCNNPKLDKASYTEGLDRGIDIGLDLGAKEKRVSKMIPAEKSIEYRSEKANDRSEYGHWEGDLVIGKRKKGQDKNMK